jgi:hypothetical protein
MVRALADLREAEQVINLVRQPVASAMAAWEQNLLYGRMPAVLGRWEATRRLAAAALRERPDLGEAHYLRDGESVCHWLRVERDQALLPAAQP